MTCYILIMRENGEEFYSVWRTKACAESEMRHLMSVTRASIYAFTILEREVN